MKNTAALAKTIERHSAMLHGFFRRCGTGQTDDLVQQTILDCLDTIRQHGDDAGLATRLIGVARNRLRAHRRSVKRFASVTLEASGVPDVVPAPSTNAALRLAQREESLHRALARLPPESRVLLELAYWRGLGRREIANVLRVPEGTVASRIRSVRSSLRSLLASDEDIHEADLAG